VGAGSSAGAALTTSYFLAPLIQGASQMLSPKVDLEPEEPEFLTPHSELCALGFAGPWARPQLHLLSVSI